MQNLVALIFVTVIPHICGQNDQCTPQGIFGSSGCVQDEWVKSFIQSPTEQAINELPTKCRSPEVIRWWACFNRYVDRCTRNNPSFRVWLDHVIDWDNLRDGFLQICSNANLMADNSACISRQFLRTGDACRSVEVNSFPNTERGALLRCRVSQRAYDCVRSLYVPCGQTVQGALSTFLSGHVPAECTELLSRTGNLGNYNDGLNAVNTEDVVKNILDQLPDTYKNALSELTPEQIQDFLPPGMKLPTGTEDVLEMLRNLRQEG